MTPLEEEQAILEELQKRRQAEQQGRVESNPVEPAVVTGPPTPNWYDKPLEFARGTVKTIAASPDLITDVPNVAITAAELANPVGEGKVDQGDLFKPVFGIREQYDKQYPVTPGAEGWRRAGEKYGGAGAIGFLLGGPLGGLGGLGAAGLSDLGSYIGSAIDSGVGNQDQRYQQLGEIFGAAVLPAVKPLSAISTRAKFKSPQTEDISAAAQRQGVPESLALLGNQAAKTTKTEPRVYRKQQEALTNLAEGNVEGIAAGAPLIEAKKASIGASIQSKAAAAAEAARNAISRGQELLTRAVGGHDFLHDPWSIVAALQQKIAEPGTTVQTAAQLRRVLSEFQANFVPRDLTLAKQLDNADAAARRVLTSSKTTPAQKATARNTIAQNDIARKANTGINEDRLRTFGSQIKTLRDTAGSGLEGFDLKPLEVAIETTRRQAAAARGFPEERWKGVQSEEMPPLYQAEENLGNRGSDPYDTGSDYNYFFGPGGDTSPGRLQAVAASQNINSELAAQYGLKVMPNGVLDLSSGQWWGTLDDAAKMLRHHGDFTLAQSLDDFGLLTRNMPGAPLAPEVDLAANIGASTARAASWGSPLALLSSPRVVGPVLSAIKRYGFGIDPVAAMKGTTVGDLASLLAKSTTLPATIQAGRGGPQ